LTVYGDCQFDVNAGSAVPLASCPAASHFFGLARVLPFTPAYFIVDWLLAFGYVPV